MRRYVQSDLRFLATGHFDENVFDRLVHPTRRSVDIVLSIDGSDSMSNKVKPVKRTLVTFSEAMKDLFIRHGANHFSDQPTLLFDLAEEPEDESLQYALRMIDSQGGFTNDLGGLNLAADMLADSTADRKIIIMVTDGEGDARQKERARELEREGFLVIGLGIDGRSDFVKQVYRHHLVVRNVSQLPRAFGVLLEDVLSGKWDE